MQYLSPTNGAGNASGTVTDDLVFASAVAIDVSTMRRVAEADTIEHETAVVLSQIADLLGQAGLTLRDIAKTTCYISDEADRMDFIMAYKKHFDPGPYPARCTFVMGLAGDCRVQVDAIADRSGAEAAA
jgi:2-iminobutanoate/2-iminopropanoate deaminase